MTSVALSLYTVSWLKILCLIDLVYGWTMATACWSAFRLTWCVDSSRFWMRRPDWSTAWGPATTWLMPSSVCTGCEFRNEFSTSWLLWRTEFYMAMHHVTLVRWSASTTCQDDDHSALPTPTASWYGKWSCQQSAAELLRLRLPTSGTDWRRRCKFTVNFSSTVKTFFISAIISWCSLLTSPNQWSMQWLCHLGHFKNSFEWLIDWLVCRWTHWMHVSSTMARTLLPERTWRCLHTRSSHYYQGPLRRTQPRLFPIPQPVRVVRL